MYFKLSAIQENELLNLPETGMGYQVIEATKSGNYNSEKYLVLNSELLIEMNSYESDHVKRVIIEGIASVKANANLLVLNSFSVFSERQFRAVADESKNENERGAIENPVVAAPGDEMFVRLSPFGNDRRIDMGNKCLLPGSFTTTMNDYLKCKAVIDDPVERYALPKNDRIQFVFYIQPRNTDTLQLGIVQPAYGKRGGGREAYFAKGTANGTFIKQTPY